MAETLACDIDRAAHAVPVREADRRAARLAVRTRARRACTSRARCSREGEPADLLLRPARGHDRAVPARRRRRRRDQPHRPARRLRRRVVGLPRGPRRRRRTRRRCARSTPTRFYVLDAGDFTELMQQWFPMALHLLEGLFFGQQRTAEHGCPARTAARARLAVGRPDPRAEQPRRGRGPRDVVAARPRRGHAAEAGSRSPAAPGIAARWRRLIDLQERAVEQVAKAPELSPLEASDREDELADWFDDHGIGTAATSWRRPSCRPASTSTGSTRSRRSSTTACSKARCAG